MSTALLENDLPLSLERPAAPRLRFIALAAGWDAQEGAVGKMVRQLCDIGDFVRRLRRPARFGDLSRASLQLLRLEVCGNRAECDWVARPPDAFDTALPSGAGERNASLQALKDAIAVPELLFRTLPDLQTAGVRVYRDSKDGNRQLIVAGSVSKEQRSTGPVRSLAMRAKLLGLRFWLNDGILENLDREERAMNS